MTISSTRLRAFQSKKLEVLLAAINKFGFKIEIKGNPVFHRGMWTVFGVIPDSVHKKFPLIKIF